MKRISICLLLLFFVAFIFLGCASTNARTAIRDLENEGFTDICVFPTKEVLRPSFFLDKYTFVETRDYAITLRNVITGKKSVILQLHPKTNNCGIKIYSLKNDEMIFSTKDKKDFDIYRYNLTEELLTLLKHIDLEKEHPLSFSFFDEEKQQIYIEQGNDGYIYCYDLLPDSKYLKKQHYERTYYDELYPFETFDTDTQEKEIHYIYPYRKNLSLHDPIKINDDEYLAEVTCGLYKSELCIVNVKTNTSRLFRLKDFGYEITWLFQVNENEYCFIVCCQNKSTVLCYFTKDILESQ